MHRAAPVHGPETRERRYDKLRKMGAVDFVGTTDPAKAEMWLKQTERVFSLKQCTPEEKFDYAVSLLQGDAYAWWETIPDSTVQPPILTWNDFLREFHDAYVPEVYKDQKEKEFLELQQGNRSVAEYEVQFNQLSRYAPHMIATEKKCTRFEFGLHFTIRNRITQTDSESYSKLKAAAIRSEKLDSESRNFQLNKKRKNEQTGGFRERKEFTLSSQRSFLSSSKGNNVRSTTSNTISVGASTATCSHCGRNHRGECRPLTGKCFRCGEPGHIARNCPMPREETTIEQSRFSGFSPSRGRGRGRFGTGRRTGTEGSQASTEQSEARFFAMTQEEAKATPTSLWVMIYLFEPQLAV
ncbi:hypothetical protein BUALT_Bualt14G0023800 [Buddleja alternifolia]|uniref:CCHC-type domain-containing protein n=1 Tax=Buddleja alternifolia TaxID=168488 RepID=A0AAV6WM79_9LAMI|nr:hypothetical protein BUALT_Bualt14G0023800 [Buddleja alternifolia]